jgi:hypothetical protein
MVALVEIVCPNCQHRGFISSASLPRTLRCFGCGQKHDFRRGAPVSPFRHLTRAQRLANIAALKGAARRQRDEADDVVIPRSDPIAALRRLNAARRAKRLAATRPNLTSSL